MAVPSIEITNELAKQRNRLAAERTLTTWLQNCLTLIVFGFAFDRIAAVPVTPRWVPVAVNETVAMAVGLCAVGFALLLLIVATATYAMRLAALEEHGKPRRRPRFVVEIAVAAVVGFGVVALIVTAITLR
jgi:putative membrane protein